MFEYITGNLTRKRPTEAVVETGGIGYRFTIPVSSYDKLLEEGKEVKIYTHLHITDSGHRLFGFASEAERGFFRLLISVSKIGPVTAITIMSGASINEIASAIVSENTGYLRRVKGIGAKTAERLIVELRESVKEFISDLSEKGVDSVNEETFRDAVLALISLGYVRTSAVKAVSKAIAESANGESLENIIKKALSYA